MSKRTAASDAASSTTTSSTPTVVVQPQYFTVEELKEYNGVSKNRIYIALKGKIYDVSERADFYGPEGGYHLFAGRDATRALAKMTFEPSELEKDHFDDLNFMERETLNDWIMKFEHVKGYPVVGRVLKCQDLTRDELKPFNGTNGNPIYVAINGLIYDVTLKGGQEFYGPQGTYRALAGQDASRALACRSSDKDLLDNPSTDTLDAQQKIVLQEWCQKFKNKYALVGKLLD